MNSINPGETVLVTGGTGSLGHALTENLLNTGAIVRIFSRDEKKQYDMKKLFPECEYLLGDIRDYHAVSSAIKDVDVIIHGASLKYVNISEIQPAEYVSTNVDGTMNLVNAVLQEKNIRRVVGISTDKACLPINTYGLTKALLEKVMLEGNRRQGHYLETVFNVARYGNVVGTRGSVVPHWAELSKANKPLTITNPEMTRFFFTLDEAVDLIDYTLQCDSDVITSKKMAACTLGDLAEVMKGSAGIVITGERPGEKQHEMLLSDDEMSKSIEDGDMFVYTPSSEPHNKNLYYGSQFARRLSLPEIQAFVQEWLN